MNFKIQEVNPFQDTNALQNMQGMDESMGALGAGLGIVLFLVYFVVIVVMIASMWKVFTKAGKPGWAALVPIYNIIVMLEIVGRPVWWILLLFIPLVGFIVGIILAIDLAKSYGKGTGFGIGLALLPVICYPMLGFGSAQYKGPAAQAAA